MSTKPKSKSDELSQVRWGACVYLLDGPMTMQEIVTSYEHMPFPFSPLPGFYAQGNWNTHSLEKLPDDLAGLIKLGWVNREGDRFSLTEQGRQQLNRVKTKIRSSSDWVARKVHSLLQPETASKATLIVQLILALIKLPAGLLSGSVGLLNDSADTLLDLFSSLLVYLGIRFNKERLASCLLVLFMLGTGSFTLFEAVQRFFTPYVPKVDWLPFAAMVVSALAGLVLWTYQRYVGIHSSLMVFITESVDSRNHVIVALSVTAGLTASLLHFGLLDMLVGLVVAILILWSAIQLAIDLLRSSNDGQLDFTHYGSWIQEVYRHLRDVHLRDWMLNLVNSQVGLTKSSLVDRALRAFDFRNNPWMKLIGLDWQFVNESEIEKCLNDLISHGWVVDKEPLSLTLRGVEYLKRLNKYLGKPEASNHHFHITLPAV